MTAKHEGGPGMQPAAPIEDEQGAGTSVARVDTYTPPTAPPVAPDPGTAVLAARAEAEIKARTMVAVGRPRQWNVVRQRLLDACKRPRFAESAFYSVPRGGKDITGLSIRFAEECARQYGNLDIGSLVVSEDDTQRVVECYVVDMETNVPWRRSVVVPKTVERKGVQRGDEVLRKRTNSRGQEVFVVRATDDQTFMLQNALISKTLRTLILNQIPSDLKDEAEETMEKVLAGDLRADPVSWRKRLVDSFRNIRVDVAAIEEYLGCKLDDATEKELVKMSRIGKAIDEKETTWEEVMRDKRETKPGAATTAAEGEENATTTSTTPPKAAGAMAALNAKGAALNPRTEQEGK